MTILVIIIVLLAIVLALSGIVGSIVPALPGPPLTLGGLVMVWLMAPEEVTLTVVIVMTVLTILAQVIDYVAPMWMTKMGGGSKRAIWGSTLGTIAGLFFMPLGLIIGPLVGAFIGEMAESNELGKATKVALMSFIAFLLTTCFKLVLSLMMTYYIIIGAIGMVR